MLCSLGKYGLECQAERLRRKRSFGSFDYDEIMEKSLKELQKREIALCESALEQVSEKWSEMYHYDRSHSHPRPSELAKAVTDTWFFCDQNLSGRG